MRRTLLRLATAFFALAPAVASAHPGHESAGLVHGFMHPKNVYRVTGGLASMAGVALLLGYL